MLANVGAVVLFVLLVVFSVGGLLGCTRGRQ
jgi:hypothetical protein